MNARSFLLGITLTALLIAYGTQQPTAQAPAAASPDAYCGICRPCKFHPGETDEQGRLVAFEAAGLCKVLESDYGLAFVKTDDPDHPAARYHLSSKETGYQTFTTLEALVTRISRIPEPRVIDFYGTCGAPTYFGLPEEDITKFFDAMKAARIELRSETPDGKSNTICTCPCPKCK